MTQTATENIFSLMISNYPPSRVLEGPVHEIAIVPGRQASAYFVGDHQECLEQARDFEAEYREHCDNSDRL